MPTSFGAKLRAERARHGITQDVLAAQSGVSQGTISNLEKGAEPGLVTYIKLVQILPGAAVTAADVDGSPRSVAV